MTLRKALEVLVGRGVVYKLDSLGYCLKTPDGMRQIAYVHECKFHVKSERIEPWAWRLLKEMQESNATWEPDDEKDEAAECFLDQWLSGNMNTLTPEAVIIAYAQFRKAVETKEAS